LSIFRCSRGRRCPAVVSRFRHYVASRTGASAQTTASAWHGDSGARGGTQVDRFGYVKRAQHGTRMLSWAELRATYGRELVKLANEGRYTFLNTLFSVSEAVMYMQARAPPRRPPGAPASRAIALWFWWIGLWFWVVPARLGVQAGLGCCFRGGWRGAAGPGAPLGSAQHDRAALLGRMGG
jgi:hypothetical protein